MGRDIIVLTQTREYVTTIMPIPDFLINAGLSALCIALVAGPLGSFVVWQRLAYFGDTLSHGALLGVAFGLFANINLTLAIVIFCLVMAALLMVLQSKTLTSNDTLLGLLSHTALAAGLVSISFLETSVDLFAYLFGDLLTTSSNDLWLITFVCIGTLVFMIVFWRKLLLSIIDEDLARVEGVPVDLMKAMLLVAVALIVAFAMKVVGVLLITALLIIPSAAGRLVTRTPEAMAAISSLVGCTAVVGGLGSSYWYNSPTGPSIVLFASLHFLLIFAVSNGINALNKCRQKHQFGATDK